MGKKKKSRRVKRVHKSAKHVGIICATFTAVQAVIWIILTLLGITCIFFKCGSGTVSSSFDALYLNIRYPMNSMSCILPPVIFLTLVVLYLLLSLFWLFASVNVIVVYRAWCVFKKIKKAANIWMFVTLVVCIVDLVVFILFLADFICLYQHESADGRSSIIDLDDLNLLDKVVAQRERIDQLKNVVQSINASFDNQTKGDELNPFLQKKVWEKVPWPTKHKPKTKYTNSSEPIDPLTNVKLNKMENVFPQRRRPVYKKKNSTDMTRTNEESKDPKDDTPEKTDTSTWPIIPPIICMSVALRFLIAWIANIALLLYFRKSIRNLRLPGSIFNRCTDLCGKRRKSRKKSSKRKSRKRKK